MICNIHNKEVISLIYEEFVQISKRKIKTPKEKWVKNMSKQTLNIHV